MKKYFKIQIQIKSAEQSEILIAKLSEMKFYAFDGEENILNAYVNDEDFNEVALKYILTEKSAFEKITIEEENWNLQWEKGITPIIIKDFVAIRPSFAPPIKTVKHELVITPKMSFGTGHHATTHLMIEMMEGINFNHKSVIDFGTGTGVLAILAEKCGASKITGVDSDEWSIKNAFENIEANNCKKIALRKQNNLAGLDAVDVILANINLNVLKNEVSSISSVAKEGSFFLASGFLVSDETEIKNIFEENSFFKHKSEQLAGWLAILFKKK